MYTNLLALLALGAATTATAASTTPKTSKPFKVHFTVAEGVQFSANVVEDNSSGSYVLAGERLSAYPGTNATFKAHSSSTQNIALIFDVPVTESADTAASQITTPYGAIVPDIGDSYGVADPVAAVAGKAQYQWGVDESTGELNHKLYAAPNMFLSCKVQLNGEETFVLKFGEASTSGALPAGCTATTVTKVDM